MQNFTEALLKKFRIKSAGDEGGEKTAEEIAAEKAAAEKAEADAAAAKAKEEEEGKNKKFDISDLSEDAQKVIKDLRAENAKHRTKNNNLSTKMDKFESGLKKLFGDDDDESTPEQKLDAMTGNYESMATRTAILELAVNNGVSGADNVEYFEFLMSKKFNSLEEGEEITEEDIEAIVAKCSTGGGKANSSTNDRKAGKKPDEKAGEVTQEQFNKMNIIQKQKLYKENAELYTKLMKNATL